MNITVNLEIDKWETENFQELERTVYRTVLKPGCEIVSVQYPVISRRFIAEKSVLSTQKGTDFSLRSKWQMGLLNRYIHCFFSVVSGEFFLTSTMMTLAYRELPRPELCQGVVMVLDRGQIIALLHGEGRPFLCFLCKPVCGKMQIPVIELVDDHFSLLAPRQTGINYSV